MLIGPTTACTGTNRVWLESKSFRPFSCRKCFTIPCEKSAAITVSCLLLWAGPTHIAGFIIAFPVKAIQGMSERRALAYITEKGTEVISPFQMHGNASRAVAIESGGRWTKTSRFDSSPDTICWRSRPAMLSALARTAATLGVTTAHAGAWQDEFITAIAAAMPPNQATAVWLRRRPDDFQFPPTATDHVYRHSLMADFLSITSAASSPSGLKVIPANYHNGSAIASTSPTTLALVRINKSQYGQTTKLGGT